ncbi:O-antigen ligase family protein [Microvirga mediterraneensis]|uniref:O-antigen ligase family protein n=1 Tax=Microvirga mediterraneensis TaxID=2754695 RepID=A0A838BR11_9HYPH|nr:O-antigen ligase family protein [Microvirga mediterraneensis]MBA1157445.1 O-antigen ligase family protein [Microvirga mediterraneensis]
MGLNNPTFVKGSLRQRFYELFLIYALVISTGAFLFHLTGTDPTVVASLEPASWLGRINQVFIYCVALSIYLMHWRSINAVARASLPLLAFPALALLSCLWAPDPSTTFRRALALFFNILIVMEIAALFSPARMVRMYILALSINVFCSLIWVFALPNYGVHTAADWVEPEHAGLWRGVFTHKNRLGYESSIALVLLLFAGRSVIQSTTFRFAAMAAAALCLIGSQSGTGIVMTCLMILVAAYSTFIARLDVNARYLFGGLGVLAVVLLLAIAIPIALMIIEALGKNTDLTGRIPLWTVLLTWASERPWLGYGYSSGFENAIMPRLREYMGVTLWHSHNGYLETFISFGYVGVFALIALLGSFARKMAMSLRLPEAQVAMLLPLSAAVLVSSILSNITEAQFFAQNTFFNLALSVAYVLLSSSLMGVTSRRGARVGKRAVQFRSDAIMSPGNTI